MKETTFAEAIREALREEMRRDERVFLLGEDIGVYGGCFFVTQGLIDEFGERRVRDTPISETAIIGAAVGAAMTGMKPVAEIMFADFIGVAMDEICNQAAKMSYMTGGQVKVPLVIRVPFGAGMRFGPQHSVSNEAWFMHIPGIKVVMPSMPYDAKGLMKSAIRDDNPVIFFEHKMLLLSADTQALPEEDYTVPLGEADVKREGEDVTVVATAMMVQKSFSVAEKLKGEVSVEVIDPRTLNPLDKKTITNSIKKTGRLLVVGEDCKTCGVSAEISSVVAEEAFDHLEAPIKRINAPDVPTPYSPLMEDFVVPSEEDVVREIREIVKWVRK